MKNLVRCFVFSLLKWFVCVDLVAGKFPFVALPF